MLGQGRPTDVGFSAQTITANVDAKVLFISYRLASNEGSRFPAALQHAVTAYQHLLDRGVHPDRIVVSGDSAGGNLALALLRHVSTNHRIGLPPPSAALLFSPWLDLKAARYPAHIDRNEKSRTDYVPGSFTAWGARAYMARHADPDSPYFAPLAHPFATTTPLWLHVGGLKVLHDEGLEFADAMRRVRGNRVEVYGEPCATHDVLYAGNVTGFEGEARRAVQAAGRFLKEQQQRRAK